MKKGKDEFDDPFEQAEYGYSLIEVIEINKNDKKQ